MEKIILTNEIIEKYPELENFRTKKDILNLKKKKIILEKILDSDYKEKFLNTFKKKVNEKKIIIIEFNDIELFEKNQSKNKNDISNKKRELIIVNIINDDINIEWLDNYKWFILSKSIRNYLEENKPFDYTIIKCELIAGRKNNDFNITYQNYQTNQNMTIKKEFKYNASEIHDCPQWVSPMHPSKFMTKNFEEYHYDNHLESICSIWGISKPNKSDFINKIHYEEPECVKELQFAYYKGAKGSSRCTGLQEDIEKCVKCKDISKKSISEFLKDTELKINELNEYLLNSQKDKEYMLFDTKTQTFKHEKPDIKDYTIKSDSIELNKTKNSFIGETESGKKITILLRWKNGNGIAFPAFQIK